VLILAAAAAIAIAVDVVVSVLRVCLWRRMRRERQVAWDVFRISFRKWELGS